MEDEFDFETNMRELNALSAKIVQKKEKMKDYKSDYKSADSEAIAPIGEKSQFQASVYKFTSSR